MKKYLALLGALIVAAGLTLVGTAPAQAFGWQPSRCIYDGGNDASVCVQLYTVPSGNGQKVNQVFLCAANYQGTHFRGTKDSGLTYTGSGGNVLGGAALNEDNPGSGCTITTLNNRPQLGMGACYKLDGILNIAQYPDQSYSIRGKVSGGAC